MDRKRFVSHEEKSLWNKVMRNVSPLSLSNRGLVNQKKIIEETKNTSVGDNSSKVTNYQINNYDITGKTLENAKPYIDLEVGTNAGLDKRNAQRLRRGKLRPEAKLDLHGHKQYEAFNELRSFVLESQIMDKRCILVITGKGSVKTGGVLRKMLPRWVNQAPLRSAVIAIENAIPRDGGSGAFYLLLRRRR